MSERLLYARAFAKINVTLTVHGRRPDGYHDLRTVLQSIALHDRLTFSSTSRPFAIACTDPRCPTDRSNLVWKAATLAWRASRRSGPMRGVHVTIEKRIPMQAGLGGGSSDAAAALRALTRLWCRSLPPARLTEMAASLGADVPFFLQGGTALGVERGDRIFPLADAPPAWVVLVQPDFGINTADAYRWFDDQDGSSRSRTTRSGDIGGPYGEGGNDLQAPVAARYPAVIRLVRALRRSGASWAAMSGSGSACFGLFETADAARSAAQTLSSAGYSSWVTRTQTARQFGRGSEPRPTRPHRASRRLARR